MPTEAHDYEKLRESVEMMQKLLPLLGELSVRQVIEAGDGAINAAGLNPYCMNEGLAEGHEKAVGQWKIHAIERDIPAILSALSLAADAGRYREALSGYRAAVAFVSADSWDGCSDCIDVLKAARCADTTDALSNDEIAEHLSRIRKHYPANRRALQESDHG